MYKGVINFTRRDCDLDRTPEYWQGESYSERIKTIQAVVQRSCSLCARVFSRCRQQSLLNSWWISQRHCGVGIRLIVFR